MEPKRQVITVDKELLFQLIKSHEELRNLIYYIGYQRQEVKSLCIEKELINNFLQSEKEELEKYLEG